MVVPGPRVSMSLVYCCLEHEQGEVYTYTALAGCSQARRSNHRSDHLLSSIGRLFPTKYIVNEPYAVRVYVRYNEVVHINLARYSSATLPRVGTLSCQCYFMVSNYWWSYSRHLKIGLDLFRFRGVCNFIDILMDMTWDKPPHDTRIEARNLPHL